MAAGEQATSIRPLAPAWDAVFAELGAADLDTLTTEDLERLAEAAFWVGRPRESMAARERAYVQYREAGDDARAARTAWLLFSQHFDLDEIAAAGGWLKRASRHASQLPDAVEGGYVALGEADWALYQGDVDAAVAYAHRALILGQDSGDRDLEALGLATEGRMLTVRGDIPGGLALLDEAMVAATGDELTPFVTGWVYCLLLYVCHSLGDIRRAGEWTDLAMRWCEERGQDSWYPGLCRLHRCEVVALRGEWATAEQEAVRAVEELGPFADYLAAEGQYLTGEIRRRRGDHAGAEEAFRHAHELGRDPQPGLALLRLAQGDAAAAASALRVALAAGAHGPLAQARLLAARVQAELRLGNVDAAGESAAALAELAATGDILLLQAMAVLAQGAVRLAAGDVDEALPLLRQAHARCHELSCPYEAAEARVLLGLAARRAGDTDTGRLELEAARATFERLGATPDVERVTALLAKGRQRPRGLTEREVEVLALVARGKTNREVAEALFISEHTVARHLTNLFRKLDVTSRSAATAFAFEHDLV